jgi:hypothetical protein
MRVNPIQKQVINKHIGPTQKEQHATHHLLESQERYSYIIMTSISFYMS